MPNADDLDDLVSSICYGLRHNHAMDWTAFRADMATFEGLDTSTAWSVIEHAAEEYGVTIPATVSAS